MSWIFEQINSNHITRNFQCERNPQQHYLRKWALINHKSNISKTTVVVSGDNSKEVVAFYTLSAAQIAFNNLSKEEQNKLPGYPVPAVRICQLAVDKRFKRQGLGTLLIFNAFESVLNISSILGVYLVILDVEKDNNNAIKFYENLGFELLSGNQPDSSHSIYAYRLEDLAETLRKNDP